MALRPLYLEPGIPWRVKLDTGIALNVDAPCRARSLFPLARLARVVCDSHSIWETAALLGCLRAGVPVVFHDARGNALGWCFGPRRRETTLASLLREGLQQPGWPDHFGRWRIATERREMLATLGALRVPSRDLDTATVRARLYNLHRTRTGVAAGQQLRHLRHAAAGLAAESIARIVDDPELIGYARPGLNLARELGDLLEWRLHTLYARVPAAQAHAGRLAAALVESHGAFLHRACGEILGDLELNLREWLI